MRMRGRKVVSRRGAVMSALVFAVLIAFALAAYEPIFADAPGTKKYTGSGVTLDVSNADQGYAMIKHKGSNKKLKVEFTFGGKKDRALDLNGNGEYEAYPFNHGSGKYTIKVYQNTSTSAKSTDYKQLFSKTITVKLKDENAPFLAPNRFSWYTKDTKAVAKSAEICAGLTTDMEKLRAVWDYVQSNMMYDYIQAATVNQDKTYLPVLDDVLERKKGICFDYSALLGCMLRVQGIPCKIVIGIVDMSGAAQAHAWNSVCIDGKWSLLDPTFGQQKYAESSYKPERQY